MRAAIGLCLGQRLGANIALADTDQHGHSHRSRFLPDESRRHHLKRACWNGTTAEWRHLFAQRITACHVGLQNVLWDVLPVEWVDEVLYLSAALRHRCLR